MIVPLGFAGTAIQGLTATGTLASTIARLEFRNSKGTTLLSAAP